MRKAKHICNAAAIRGLDLCYQCGIECAVVAANVAKRRLLGHSGGRLARTEEHARQHADGEHMATFRPERGCLRARRAVVVVLVSGPRSPPLYFSNAGVTTQKVEHGWGHNLRCLEEYRVA